MALDETPWPDSLCFQEGRLEEKNLNARGRDIKSA
ncbi:unnamed protein product, partial [marine sediment metagenome]